MKDLVMADFYRTRQRYLYAMVPFLLGVGLLTLVMFLMGYHVWVVGMAMLCYWLCQLPLNSMGLRVCPHLSPNMALARVAMIYFIRFGLSVLVMYQLFNCFPDHQISVMMGLIVAVVIHSRGWWNWC